MPMNGNCWTRQSLVRVHLLPRGAVEKTWQSEFFFEFRTTKLIDKAISNRDIETIKVLADNANGANLNVIYDYSCITYVQGGRKAISEKYADVVECLLDKGANTTLRVKKEMPLHLAIREKDLECAKILIDKGAYVEDEEEGYFGNRALHIAAGKNLELVKFLLKRSADANSRNRRRETPLYQAIRQKQNDIVKLLINKGVALEVESDSSQRPIHVAACKGLVVTNHLLEKSVDVNVKVGRIHPKSGQNSNFRNVEYLVETGFFQLNSV